MEIIILVIFKNENPPQDLYYIPSRRLYCLERDNGGTLVWTLYTGVWRPEGDALPVLFRDWSCVGADLLYDQVEFERACEQLSEVRIVQKLTGTKIEVTS